MVPMVILKQSLTCSDKPMNKWFRMLTDRADVVAYQPPSMPPTSVPNAAYRSVSTGCVIVERAPVPQESSSSSVTEIVRQYGKDLLILAD